MLTNKSVVVLVGLDKNKESVISKTETRPESKCIRFQDEAKTFKCALETKTSLEYYNTMVQTK